MLRLFPFHAKIRVWRQQQKGLPTGQTECSNESRQDQRPAFETAGNVEDPSDHYNFGKNHRLNQTNPPIFIGDVIMGQY